MDTDYGMPVRIRHIDWTRNLVESTLNKHSLFLLGKQRFAASGNELVRTEYFDWQSAMLANDIRHVVIVGGVLDTGIDALYDQAIEACGNDQARKRGLGKHKRDSKGAHKPFRLQDNDYLSF